MNFLIYRQRLGQIPREIGIVRIQILPQHMEALRADGRVRFSGLPRTEAGIYPADTPTM